MATTDSTPTPPPPHPGNFAPETPPSGFADPPFTPVTDPIVSRKRTSDEPSARQRWISIGAAVALAVVGGIVLLAWPKGGDPVGTPSTAESGEGAIGAAPGAGTSGTPQAGGAGTGTPAPGASGGPGASADLSASPSPSPGPTSRTGSFVVSSRVTSGLLKSTVEITVRNASTATDTWHSVMVETNGGTPSSTDPSVTYQPQGGKHCFVPADGTLAAGSSYTFTVEVPGLLATVSGTPLDTPPCPA